jgi:hypothetical protein
MLDYRKVNGLAKDTARARRTAALLLKLEGQDWTDWELDFLSAMSERRDDLTTRQAEKLIELEDAAVWHEKVPGDGFSVRLLVKGCHAARFDLDSEDDVAFVEALWAQGAAKLRRRALSRLVRCARALGVIETHASEDAHAEAA